MLSTCRLNMLYCTIDFRLQKLQKVIILAFVEVERECLILHLMGVEDLATEIYRQGTV